MEKILVAEDDAEIRTGIKYLLAGEGFEVIEAEDGNKALEVLNSNKVDLIISDIMMPNKNGYDLLNEIQKDEQLTSIPFLFLTAKTSYEDFRKGMNLGVDDYITKPFKAYELLQAINVRLKKKHEIETKFESLKSGVTKYVPHELRTPLVSIIGFSDLILNEYKENTPEDVVEMVERINVAGSRLLRTIEKFLIFTELKSSIKYSNKDIPNCSLNEFSIARVFEDVNNKLFKIYNNKFTVNDKIAEKRLGITENHFQILLTELIDNAIKFSSPYETVKVNAKVLNDFYKIEIINKGKEFSESQIKKISEFVQFDRDEFQQNGNGLGLTIAKSILIINGGIMEINSKDNISKVVVKIPLLKED